MVHQGGWPGAPIHGTTEEELDEEPGDLVAALEPWERSALMQALPLLFAGTMPSSGDARLRQLLAQLPWLPGVLWNDSSGPGSPYIQRSPEEFDRWSAAFGDLVQLALRHMFALTPEELLRARNARVDKARRRDE